MPNGGVIACGRPIREEPFHIDLAWARLVGGWLAGGWLIDGGRGRDGCRRDRRCGIRDADRNGVDDRELWR
jgi:hypothetical protein